MPREGAISGETVEEMVKTLARLHANPEILAAIEDAATSCMKWGSALQSLFVDGSLNMLYVRDRPGKVVQGQDLLISSEICNKARQYLRK